MTDRRDSDSCNEREGYEEEVDRLFEAADALMASDEKNETTEQISSEPSPEKQRFRDVFRRVATISQLLRILEEYRHEQDGVETQHKEDKRGTDDTAASGDADPASEEESEEEGDLCPDDDHTPLALKSGGRR
ncbi:hypothetical protein [Allosediminivita pacifica]|uniref:Uncharacterized protein n=1 Tax=Allosediminivita pacifica TaxID=1267769 RepID=A0A2T6B9T7_9RHOB|nr:hypothetical protein [Allosediminivita pacifica]PTX52837.1 hypothetical protein C8N44_101127 [Allosediminivita pacifica]GGA95447.1 hypothetical protein GCM10011324_02170 [Allosediminivita pacifica]